jgi:hypothetical protein
MDRVATGSQAAALPTVNAAVGTPGFFNNQPPGLGVIPTIPGPDWFNLVQEELVSAIAGAGVALDRTKVNQALLAVKRLAGGNVTTVVAGTTTLTADNAGLVLVNASAGAVTIDLPAVAGASGIPLRFRLIRTDSTANAVTIAPNGADTFASQAWQTVSAPSLSLGTPLELIGDGASHWLTAVAAQMTRYTAAQSGSITPANDTVYDVSSVAITFPAVSKTGAFRVMARLIAQGSSLLSTAFQNFQNILFDGTLGFGGAEWYQNFGSASQTWGTSDFLVTSQTYAPGATVTFTQRVGVSGGTVNGFSISGANMELYVVEA